MHAISSYRGNRPTQTQPQNPQTGPITIHCAAKLSAQYKYNLIGRGDNQISTFTIYSASKVTTVRLYINLYSPLKMVETTTTKKKKKEEEKKNIHSKLLHTMTVI